MKSITPSDIRPPFARYAHGIEIPVNHRLIQTSGQLGITPDDHIPDDPYDQAMICFDNISKILEAGHMSIEDIAHVTAYVTDRFHMAGYMAARDQVFQNKTVLPSSTLLIVSGFTNPEFKVEVEVLASAI